MSQQPNVVYQTECNAAVEQTENVEARESIADVSLESNEIEDEKDSSVEYQIECKEAAAVERIENERDGPTEQVTEIATDISLNEVEDRESQHSSSFEKIQKEWTCEVCEVKTSSESYLRSHLRGKLHKEYSEILNLKNQSTTGEQYWTCLICQTVTTNRKDIIQHIRGTHHNVNRELFKTHQPRGNYATSNVAQKVPCNSTQQKQGAAKSCTSEIRNHQWRCALCNISCSSKGNMDDHLNGSKHLAKIKESHGDGNIQNTAVMPTLKQDELAKEQGKKYTKQVLVCWQFPEPGWIKVNVDGSVRNNGGIAACGGVFRNERGYWIIGFAHNLGPSSSFSILKAELWGILTALDLATKGGLRNICVESDSLAAINLVKQGCDETHPQATIVHAITRIIMSSNMEVLLQHTLREGNRVADWLANWSLDKDFGVHVVQSPPDECRAILMEDRMGVASPRSINV